MPANFPYLPYVLLAIGVGVLGGIHIPINGALGARLDSTPVATFAFYGVAFGLISLVCLISWDRAASLSFGPITPGSRGARSNPAAG
jgi:uncharacterized membrane protein YdcZ (DUF606 family)